MTTTPPNRLQRNVQGILAGGTVAIAVLGLITATASAWNALDSKADRTAMRLEENFRADVDRIEAKIDAAITEMREDRRQMLEERRIWLEQFNRVEERIDALDRRALALEDQ